MAEQAKDSEDAQPVPRWLDELRPGGDGRGFLEKNLRHSLLFIRRPVNRLLVTFDNLSNVGDTSFDREPWAFKFAQDNGLSHLGIMAHVSDWYRDPDLIARMETLQKDGFFDGYDRVVFAGVSMGGYAAIAFGSLVPGAHVISINPQSTLDPELVPWETRYEKGRRQDWTLPLGDAARLTGKLGRVNIFYDPYFDLDQKHVDRFEGENIRIFKCWFSNHKTAVFLRKIGALKPVMTHCIFDELTELSFYQLYRERRYLPWYRGSLSAYFRELGRIDLGEAIDLAFRKRLRARSQALAAEGPQPEEDDGIEVEVPKRTKARARAAKVAAPATEPATAPATAPVPLKEYIKALKRPQGDAPKARIIAPEGMWEGQPDAKSGPRVIVTTMKNEGPFMLEWVAYNRAIGFSDFLIYTNDCDDNTDKIADRLQELGLAQHRENRFKKGGSPQRTALRACQSEPLIRSAEWLICADCDEFLNIRVGKGRLDDLFAAVGDADAVSVCWKLFGNSGRLSYEEGLITEQFDWCLQEDEYPNFRARGMKTLVRRSERLERLRIHRPAFRLDRGDVKWVDGGGRPMPDAYLEGGWKTHAGFTHDLVRMHHYAVRSVDSFLVKRDRGRTNHVGDDQGESYWSTMNYNSTRDRSIHARLPMLRAEMDSLLADPELARLHAGACDWHRAKITELTKRDGWAEFRDRISQINAAPQEPEEKAKDARV